MLTAAAYGGVVVEPDDVAKDDIPDLIAATLDHPEADVEGNNPRRDRPE